MLASGVALLAGGSDFEGSFSESSGSKDALRRQPDHKILHKLIWNVAAGDVPNSLGAYVSCSTPTT